MVPIGSRAGNAFDSPAGSGVNGQKSDKRLLTSYFPRGTAKSEDEIMIFCEGRSSNRGWNSKVAAARPPRQSDRAASSDCAKEPLCSALGRLDRSGRRLPCCTSLSQLYGPRIRSPPLFSLATPPLRPALTRLTELPVQLEKIPRPLVSLSVRQPHCLGAAGTRGGRISLRAGGPHAARERAPDTSHNSPQAPFWRAWLYARGTIVPVQPSLERHTGQRALSRSSLPSPLLLPTPAQFALNRRNSGR